MMEKIKNLRYWPRVYAARKIKNGRKKIGFFKMMLVS